MRLFIAVTLPDPIKRALQHVQDDLAAAAQGTKADIRWVRPDPYHFTLKFLGECTEGQVAEIKAALKMAVEGTVPFSLRIGTLGTFPEKGAIRVIWLGLLEGEPPMKELAGRVGAACERLSFPKEERSFSAHVTMGRGKGSKNMAKLRAVLDSYKMKPMETVRARSITLIRSVLSPKGPTYTNLQEFELHASPTA